MAGIFINYRRDDVPGVAGRLYDHLAQKFPPRQLFIDVDAIKPGLDFVEQIDTQIAQCHVVLAVIGTHWLADKDQEGRKRLDDANDFVRLELASALKRNIPLIPILVDGAAMPSEQDLPPDLKPLARREALELRYTRFDSDADAIVQALRTIIPKRRLPWRAIIPGAAACLVIAGAVVSLLPRPTPTPPPLPPRPAIVPTKPVKPIVVVPPPVAPPRLAVVPAGVPPASANLLVAIGDSATEVQTRYGIKSEPISEGGNELMLGAPLDGLMFFFNEQDKILSEIRADAPFGGTIDGVRIGDTLSDVISKLGQPTAPPWDFGKNKAYIFSVSGHKLRCDFDPDGKVATLLLLGH